MNNKSKKRLLLSLCCAFMFSATPLALSACDEPEGYDETGVYYCVVDGKEYLLSLSGEKFSLVMGESNDFGTYKFKGDVLTLRFDDKKAENTAKLTDEGVATVTINGKNYTFLKKVNYQVTYEVNGGSAITPATVLNGKTLSKPADPKKDGYYFIGWYTDAEFTTPFAFNATPITENITLYARFEAALVGQDEYTVTFVVDGASNVYDTKKTVSGKVFDLPTPTKEGATFAGWWLSDAQDASKLTCKYEGQVLNENTKLFAVWASNAPLVSVTKTGVTWSASGANNSYTVKITAPNESDNVTQTVGESKFDYDFSKKAAGEYVVEVTLGDKTTKAYYNNKQLADVSFFAVVEPSVLVFNAVENAEKYLITVDCGNEKHEHVAFDNGTSVYYNFANCDMQEDGIVFTVEAVADGYMTSKSGTFAYSRDLKNVTGLKVDAAKEQVSWDRVSGAFSYVVEIKKGDTTTKVNVGAKTSYSLKEYSGALTIKVYPVANGYNSPDGVSVNYTKANLATPSNVHFEGKKLVWNAVEGATKYNVKIGTQVYETTTASYDLSNLAYAAEYVVSVQSVGATADKNSAYSQALTVKADVMSEKLVYNKGEISWTPVLDADSYSVKVNGGTAVQVDGKFNSYAVKLTKAGANKIEVCAYYRGQKITDWVSTEVFAYEIEFDARGGSDVAPIYKAIGDKIELPTDVTYEGYIFAGWYNVPGGPKNNGAKYEDEYYMENGNTVLYAYWTPQDYEVTLTVNGEEGTIDQTKGTVYYKENYTLPVAVSKDTTRVFGGWYAQPNGGGTQYTDPLGNSKGVWSSTQGLVLYAHWIDVFSFNAIDNGAAYSVSKGLGIDYVTEITIPSTYSGKPVTTIEGSAFKSCSKLKKIKMPDTIQLVAIPVDGGNGTGSPFESCTYLESVEVYCVDPDNHNKHEVKYSSSDGVLLYHQGEEIHVKYVPYRKRGSFEIPDGVTTIPINAFKGTRLSEVIIPASVTLIEETAFTKGSTDTNSNLTSVVFKLAAEGVEEKPLQIAKNAFRYCNQLTSVTLPARLVDFNIDIFTNCTKLAKIFIEGRAATGVELKYASTKDGVLTNVDGDTIVYVPKGRTGEYSIPKGITAIGAGAFQDCKGLTKVTIPSWVQTIEANAFRNCTSLRSVVFEGEATDMPLTIEQYAFYGCTGLTTLELPENLAKLEKYAFGGTSSLTEVKVTGANMELENVAFGTNSASPEYYVTDLFIGKDVKEFEVTGVFGGQTLARVKVEAGNQNYVTTADGVLFNGDQSTIVYFPTAISGEYEIVDSVKTIGAEVFRNKYITKVIVGKNVTSIGEGAFMDCSQLETVEFKAGTADLEIAKNAFLNCAKIKEIQLPDRLISLGDYAFAGTSLTSIEIPEKTIALGSTPATVFEGCEPFTNITVDPNNSAFAAIDGILYGKVNGVITTLYFAPALNSGKNGVVDIPKTVVSVGDKAFYGNENITEIKFSQGVNGELVFGTDALAGMQKLEKVSLPVGMTTISAAMFKNITTLKTVIVPYTITNIQAQAFSGCSNLSLVQFDNAPSGKTAPSLSFDDCAGTDKGAFYGCTSLTTLQIPARTTYLGSYSFGYAGVTSITIPKAVTALGNGAFYYAQSLETVTFEKGSTISEMPYRLFDNCIALKKINNLPETVTSLGNSSGGSVFASTAITEFTVPGGVTLIAGSTFSNCAKLENVTFAAGTEDLTIQDSAFNNCLALKYVKIPARTVVIGQSAFKGCSALGTDTAKPKGVEFEANSRLERIGLGLTGQTFYGCTGLTEFTFPETIKVITDVDTGATSTIVGSIDVGKQLFYGCTNLKKVHISSTVTSIDQSFINSTAIEEITVSPNNKNIKYDSTKHIFTNVVTDTQTQTETVDAYLYAYGQLPAAALDSEGTLTIPDGIKSIADYAFQKQTGIKKISFPASLEYIGSYAFDGCTNLAEIEFRGTSSLKELGSYVFQSTALVSPTLPNSIDTMGSYVFSKCTKLTSANIPTGITSIPGGMFSGCTSLVTFTVPTHVTSLGNSSAGGSVFNGCTKLETVTLHDGIEYIGSSTFKGCSKLNNVTLPDNTSFVALENNLFENCKALTTITIPANVTKIGTTLGTGATFKGCSNLTTVIFEGTNVTAIQGYSFQNCTKLVNFTMPENLSVLGRSAFNACKALTNITLPVGLTELDEFKNSVANPHGEGKQFQGCTSLTTVTINGALSKITGYLFDGCTSLSSINFPESVIAIDAYAFRNTGFTTITLPELSRIETYAFANCAKLTSVTLNEAQRILGTYMFYNCPKLETINLPSNLVGIPTYAFSKTALTSVQIPEKTSEIGDYAFTNCKNLAQVNLGEGVKSIGIGAFYGTGVRSITIPASVTSIGGTAFFECNELTDMSVDSSNVVYAIDAEGTLWADNMKRIVSFSPTAELEGGVLTLTEGMSFETYAFYGCTNIKKVVMPDSLKTIPDYAFYGCTTLREVEFGNGIEEVGAYAFYGCSSLEAAMLPETTELIGLSAFEKSGVKAISISGVKYLGTAAFAETPITGKIVLPTTLDTTSSNYKLEKVFYLCTNITELEVPSNVTTIYTSAFEGCSNLETVTIAEGLTSMYNNAFKDCVKLKNLTVPSTCVTYGNYVYANTAIESFTFPSTLKSPGGYLFTNCKKLRSVVFEDGPTTFGYQQGSSNWWGMYMLQGCTALEEFVLPNTLQSLLADGGRSMFNLNASDNCEVYSLKKVVIPASIVKLQKDVFRDLPADCQVYVRGSESAYAPLWETGWDSYLTLPVIWDYTGN